MPSNVKPQRRSCPYDLRKRVLINNFLKTQMKLDVENIPPKRRSCTSNQDWTSQPQSTMRKVLRSLSCKLRSSCSKKVIKRVKSESRRCSLRIFDSKKSASRESLLSPQIDGANKPNRRFSGRLSVSNLKPSFQQRYKPITPSPPAKWSRNRRFPSDNIRNLSTNASPIRHSIRSSKRSMPFRRALERLVSSSASEDIVTYASSSTPKTSFITKMFRNFSVKENNQRTVVVNRCHSLRASPSESSPASRPPRRAFSMRTSITKLR